MSNVYIQALGILGVSLFCAGMLSRRRSTILLFSIASPLLWVVHYLALGAVTGAIMNAVAATRTGLFFIEENHSPAHRSKIIFLVCARTYCGDHDVYLGGILQSFTRNRQHSRHHRVVAKKIHSTSDYL